MQVSNSKALAELSLMAYRQGQNIAQPIDEIIQQLERPLTALEKIDIEKRSYTPTDQATTAANLAALAYRTGKQRYTTSILAGLEQGQLAGLMAFAGFTRSESTTPMEDWDEKLQTRLYYAIRKILELVGNLRKAGLFNAAKFTTYWQPESNVQPIVQPMSELERQKELLKLAAHSQRMSEATTQTTPANRGKLNHEAEQQLREQWAELERQYFKLENNPNTTIEQLKHAKETAIAQLGNWQVEATAIFALELVNELEKRIEDLGGYNHKEAI